MKNKSEELYQRAIRALPGGVDSPVRAFKAVGGLPPFIERGEGCRVWDADGIEYIDYIGSWGPLIAGHAHPEVIRTLNETAQLGTSYGMPSRLEVELAEEVKNRMPAIERIRFVNSGTEAAMSAIRLARAYTNREKIIKFAGCYHGHADSFLVSAGSGVAAFGLPDSPGVTDGAVKDTLTAKFNDLKSVDELFSNNNNSIAAIIVEPVTGNMGVIPPNPGFLSGLRDLCDKNNSLLIFDEVMTGFRVARGGAQELYGIKGDLVLTGKVIGGGLPVGAFGGRAEIMDMLAPLGPVYQAGTLSGNPLAMAGGLATLRLLDDEAYNQLEKTARRLEEGLVDVLIRTDQTGRIQRVGSMLTLFFTNEPVRNFNGAQKSDHKKFARFFHKMLDKGVLLPPSGYEAWFVSTTHDDNTIDLTIDTAFESLHEL